MSASAQSSLDQAQFQALIQQMQALQASTFAASQPVQSEEPAVFEAPRARVRSIGEQKPTPLVGRRVKSGKVAYILTDEDLEDMSPLALSPRDVTAERDAAHARLDNAINECSKWTQPPSNLVELVAGNEAEHATLAVTRKSFASNTRAFMEQFHHNLDKAVPQGKGGKKFFGKKS